MNTVTSEQLVDPAADSHDSDMRQKAAVGANPEVLANIYDEQTNIAIWRRQLPADLEKFVDDYVASRQQPYTSAILSPSDTLSVISKALGNGSLLLGKNIAELVDMFCCLFDLKQAGLRMTVLRDSMCPKFHVDHVPCRLVTTYQGVGTQWLPHHLVNRDKLGMGSAGLPDHESGIYADPGDIQSIACGEVALLKGETWQGNQHAGMVHRSPPIPEGESRLLLTLDFSR